MKILIYINNDFLHCKYTVSAFKCDRVYIYLIYYSRAKLVLVIYFMCCRNSPIREEYQEDLFVEADIVLEGTATKQNVLRSKIESKKKFNSWFYVDFGEIFGAKGSNM